MQGNILNYSEDNDVGIITGPGGSRYKFSKADWKESCPVISRVNVDFVVEGDRATEIYCTDTDALKASLDEIEAEKAAERAKFERQKKEIEKSTLKKEFSGFYRSADKKLWKGVLAGLAHKFGHKALWYRAFSLFLVFWVMIRAGKDNVGEGVRAAVGLGFVFAVFYFYAAKKWRAKETNSAMANEYFSQTKEKADKKSIDSINSLANIMGALAGKGAVGVRSDSAGSINKPERIQKADYSSKDNNESSGAQASYNQEKSSAFPARTPVAIRGAVLLGRGKYDNEASFNYCHKCEACGHATTNITQSHRCDFETTYTGKFYCIKCGNLQDVEIRVV